MNSNPYILSDENSRKISPIPIFYLFRIFSYDFIKLILPFPQLQAH